MNNLNGPLPADSMAGANEFYREMHKLYLYHIHQSRLTRVGGWVQWIQWQSLWALQVGFYISAVVLMYLIWRDVQGTMLHTHSLTRSADVALLNTMDGFAEATPEQRSNAVKTMMSFGNIAQDFDKMGITQSVGIGARSVSSGMAQGDYDDGVNAAFGLLSATFMGFKNGDLKRFYSDAMDTRSMVNSTINRADGYAREFMNSNATVADVVKGVDVPGVLSNISMAAGAVGQVAGHTGVHGALDVVSKATKNMALNGGDEILGANFVRMTESAATITEQMAENRTITEVKTLTGTIDELRQELTEMRYMMTTMFEALRQFKPESTGRSVFEHAPAA